MNRQEEIEMFMQKLKELWLFYPQQRFGQLLFNYTRIGTRAGGLGFVRDPFNYIDYDILTDIEKELRVIK